MKLKIGLLSLLIAIGPQMSSAISIGSISDAISNNTSIAEPQTNTAKKVAEPTHAVTATATAENQKTQPTENHLPNPALFIEDAAMTGYIHTQLLLDRSLPRVSVSTENAVVSLSGTVDTQEQVDKLVKIASAVKGVKRVNTDGLVVRREA